MTDSNGASQEQKYESISKNSSEKNENTRLWASMEKTPPSQTKPAKMGNINITSVKPHYQRMKATEVFGPYGKGWGVVPGSETFREVIINEVTKDKEGIEKVKPTHLLKYSAILFYVLDGERYEFPIHATEKEAYVTSSGYLKIDDCADKKVATNALTKGLSFLGMSADVFHGLYDDARYIMKAKEEEGIQEDLKAVDEKHEYKRWRGVVQGQMLTCKDLDSLEKLYVESLRKAAGNSDNQLVNTLKDLKVQRISELKTAQEKKS